MSDSFIRCHYTSPEGFECESWFKSERDEKDEPVVLCPIHRGMVSVALAANGINKDPYIVARNEKLFSLNEELKGKTRDEKFAFLDAHVAGIEKAIEKLKIEAMTTRAVRQTELEGLSDEERKERQKIKASSHPPREPKTNVAKDIGKAMKLREQSIANMVAKGKTREQAIALLDMD